MAALLQNGRTRPAPLPSFGMGLDPFRATIPLRAASPRRDLLPPVGVGRRAQPPVGRIRAVAIDADGVLRNGDDLVTGAAEFVRWLHGRRLAVGLITNSARKTADALHASLGDQGIEIS